MSDKLLKFEAVQEVAPFGRTKIYDMIARGDFPKPVKIGAASRWSKSEVDAWVDARKKERERAGC